MSTSTVLWLPWIAGLTAVFGWLALRARHRGDGLGAVRWLGWALLPPALLMTGSVGLVGRITSAVASWSANLVFNPLTWAGLLVGGVGVVMIGGATALRRRRDPAPAAPSGRDKRAVGPAKPKQAPVDDDMAEIEEILRRRGIG